MKKVRTHAFNGRKYDITVLGDVKLSGVCTEVPRKGKPEIIIAVDLNTQDGIITAIHEGFHASCWNTTEEVVTQLSEDIGKFLWRLGFRRKS